MKKLVINILDIKNFRGIKNCSLTFNDHFNLIEGCNGLGKSSILDAIRYIFFYKNSDNKKADNFKGVHDGSLPHIVLTFSMNGLKHVLKTNNKKWFIDNIEFKNNEEYLKQIAKIVGLDSIDELFVRTNPHLLVQTISGKGDDKKELKDDFVKIINLGLDKNNKLENFEELVNEKAELTQTIKRQKENIKDKKQELEYYQSSHGEIKDWDSNNNYDVYQLNDISKKINEYEEIKKQIISKTNLIDENKIKIHNLKNNTNNNTISTYMQKKESKFKIIFLTIITLGIYLFFYKQKAKKNISTENNQIQANNEYEIKRLNDENTKIQKEIDKLMKDSKFYNINYDKLINQQSELKIQERENIDLNTYKLQYQAKKNIIKNEEQKLNKLNDRYSQLDNQYKTSLKKIEKIISDNFKGFKVSLFDAKGSDNFNISQNSVDLKNLNYASKNNIIHIINQFIKKGINIDCFNLIDQVESFNELSIKNENTQTIACKVTNDKKIKLNGKIID